MLDIVMEEHMISKKKDTTIFADNLNDTTIKFKFDNNKKALNYKFKSADSNDFTLGICNTSTLGICNTSEWIFPKKQEEQKLNYDFDIGNSAAFLFTHK